MEKLLRPYGLVIGGRLELGLEIVVSDRAILEVRPHTGIPEQFVISAGFVNAHSHLEYRGLQGRLHENEYWPWIREITEAKRGQDLEQVRADSLLAARENRETGVAIIAEHSDRPFAAEAMRAAGLDGVIFQEVITRFEAGGPADRVRLSAERALEQLCVGQQEEPFFPVFSSPHAYQTVDDDTLRMFARSGAPFSIHVAETDLENRLTLSAAGSIAETFEKLGTNFAPTGKRLVPTLGDLGLIRKGAQFVHCCAIDQSEVELLASKGVSVAHCPRSNRNLHCPIAPVREMLDSGIKVGLGLDSPASSGPIDMFAEMRCALAVSMERGRALSPEEVWVMATEMGADSLQFARPDTSEWRIQPNSAVDLIKIHVPDALSTEDLIQRATPGSVEWI